MGFLINGVNYSWGDVTFIWFGIPLVGFKGIDFKAKQEKTNNHGGGNEPISRGRGRIEYECSIKGVYLDELRPLRALAPNDSLLQLAPSNCKILIASTTGVPVVITLKNMEFLEDPFAVNEGDTAIINDLPLIISGITYA